jgi:hypothetical protein
MPTLTLTQTVIPSLNTTNSPVPVMAAVVEAQSGSPDWKLVLAEEDLSVMFPDVKNRATLRELLNTGNPLLLRKPLHYIGWDDKYSRQNKANIIVGWDDQHELGSLDWPVDYLEGIDWTWRYPLSSMGRFEYIHPQDQPVPADPQYYPVPPDDDLVYKWLSKYEVYDIYDQRTTYSYVANLFSLPNPGDYFVIPAQNGLSGLVILFGDPTEPFPDDDLPQVWISSVIRVPIKSTIFLQMKAITDVLMDEFSWWNTMIRFGIDEETNSGAILIGYPNPVNRVFKSRGINLEINMDYNLDRLITRAVLDVHHIDARPRDNYYGICLAVAKYPGVEYNNITISFEFNVSTAVQVTIKFNELSEVWYGSLDSTKENYIENVINRGSRLVEFTWLGGDLDHVVPSHPEFTRKQRIDYYINKITKGSPYRFFRSRDEEFLIDDWDKSMRSIMYAETAVYTMIDVDPLIPGDIPISNSIKYRQFLVNLSNKYNLPTLLNLILPPPPTDPENPTPEEILTLPTGLGVNQAYIGDSIESYVGEKLLPALGAQSLWGNNLFLGRVIYNVPEILITRNEDNTIFQDPVAVPIIKIVVNHYNRDINRIDELYDVTGDLVFVARVALVKFTKTVTAIIRNSIPDVTELVVWDALEYAKSLLPYVDTATVHSFIKAKNTVQIEIEVTSVHLSITNKILNITINL